jgi:hypothetical protein
MQPNFRDLFMKKLTRERVVPIISLLVEIRQQQKQPCETAGWQGKQKPIARRI